VTEGPPAEDDLVPVSVRLGTVVPPEDPEDWTRPLTWVVAAGIVAGAGVAAAWYAFAAPGSTAAPAAGTWATALALGVGAAAAGATQIGRARAFAGTLAAALLGGLLVVLVGAASAGERQLGAATPTLAHAFAAAAAGVGGALPAAMANGLVAGWDSRLSRFLAAATIGGATAALIVPRLFLP